MVKILKKNNISLYAGFIITLMNIGYYITREEYQTIISYIVIISVCSMFTKNMFLLLLFGIVGMNIFYLIKEDSIETMVASSLDMSYNSFKKYVNDIVKTIDISSLDNSNKEFVVYIKSNFKMDDKEYYIEFKNKYRQMSDTKWIDKNIIDFKDVMITDETNSDGTMNRTLNNNDEGFSGDIVTKIDENTTPSEPSDLNIKEDIENIVNKLKETSPELSKSLDVINNIDINEMNKLINNVNTMLLSTSA
jgi:hypothetical protein